MAKAKTRYTCPCGREIGGRGNIERHRQSCEKYRSFMERRSEFLARAPLIDARRSTDPYYGYMVLINREGVSDATLFERETEARIFYEKARLQWSDSFLTRILHGPHDWMYGPRDWMEQEYDLDAEESIKGKWLGLPLALLFQCIERQEYELYSTMSNPDGWSKGRTLSKDELRKVAEEDIRVRYRRGVCAFCEGPAMRCAPRHAEGRSCA